MAGGNAMSEAVAAQNFRKPRLDTPRARNASPMVWSFVTARILLSVLFL
jgi:hypothetical protein